MGGELEDFCYAAWVSPSLSAERFEVPEGVSGSIARLLMNSLIGSLGRLRRLAVLAYSAIERVLSCPTAR